MNLRVLDAADDLIGDLAQNALDALDALDAQIQRINAARVTVAKFLADLKGSAPDTAPALAPQPKPAATQEEQVMGSRCPACDKTFSNAHGLQVHHARTHGPNAKKTTSSPKSIGVNPTLKAMNAQHGKVLACTACDATFPIDNAHALMRHAVEVHHRQATHEERQPVVA